jgi:hypothetical protein
MRFKTASLTSWCAEARKIIRKFEILIVFYPSRNLIGSTLAHCPLFPTQPPEGVRTLLHFHAAVHPPRQLKIIGL